MAYLVGVAVGFAFGAIDQFLGSLWSFSHLGFWTVSVSLMSAPWLALPFVFGSSQTCARRAAVLGLVATLSALLGYFALTLSPLEGVSPSNVHIVGFIHSQLHVIAPGLVTGPVFGWLGGRWRTARSWGSAALVAAAFCLEPAARQAAGQVLPGAGVGRLEVMFGIATGAYFAVVGLRFRRRACPLA